MTPGVAFTNEEKKILVRKMDEVGIHQIQIANLGFNDNAKLLAAEICSMGLNAKTELMTSGNNSRWKEAIDYTFECNPDIIHCGLPVSSQIYAPAATDAGREHLKKRACEAMEYIKSKGKIANISLADSMRADPEFLVELVTLAAKAGADRIRIADSVGVGSPEGVYETVSRCVEAVEPYGAIIGVHNHNDFGLALANTLAAVKAGAKLIDTCVDGLGDRCGNTSSAELAVATAALYGREIDGIQLSKLTELSQLTSKLTRLEIDGRAPLVGRYAFSNSAEDHIKGQEEYAFAFQGILPEEIGTRRLITFGKNTGPFVIGLMAKTNGVDIPEELYPAIRAELTKMAEDIKGRPLFDEDFWVAVERVKAGV